MFIIFEKLAIEDVPEEIIEDIIKEFNEDPTSYNKVFLGILQLMEDLLIELKKDNLILAISVIEYITAFEFSAKTVQLVIKHKKHLLKIKPSEIESIKLNTSSIINAVKQIQNFQAERLKDLNPEEVLVALTT